MTCVSPLDCYYPIKKDVNGKRKLIFKEHKSFIDVNGFVYEILDKSPSYLHIKVPCGKCIGCKIDKSREYALRSMDEKYIHPVSCFVTLTLNNENNDFSLHKAEFRSFMKRFRYFYGNNIRFMAVGEYGSPKNSFRPHYHVIFYNFNFPDAKPFYTDQNVIYKRSKHFEENVWTKGYSVIGDVTLESSAYVARYCTKKLYDDHKGYIVKARNLEPEFLLSSRMPGLGYDYFMSNPHNLIKRGYSTLTNAKGQPIKFSIPRYYRDIYKKFYPDEFEIYTYENLLRISEKYLLEGKPEQVRSDTLKELCFLDLDKLQRNYELDNILHNI